MERIKFVQLWTTADQRNDERLDADILILRQRVWERVIRESRTDARNAKLRIIGTILLVGSACVGYFWFVAR